MVVAAAKEQAVLEPLGAEFVARMTDRSGRTTDKSEWYLVRKANRIETIRPNLQIAEVWERDERNDLALRRIFHAERRVIEYQPSDLRAMGIGPAWSALGSVIDPRLLGQLKPSGTKQLPQGKATVYKGRVDKEQVEIWWLDRVSLPARIARREKERSLVLTLKRLYATVPAGWPRVDQAEVQTYFAIDAADLGDMHYDPFVRKVERFDAETQAFGHLSHFHAH